MSWSDSYPLCSPLTTQQPPAMRLFVSLAYRGVGGTSGRPTRVVRSPGFSMRIASAHHNLDAYSAMLAKFTSNAFSALCGVPENQAVDLAGRSASHSLVTRRPSVFGLSAPSTAMTRVK